MHLLTLLMALTLVAVVLCFPRPAPAWEDNQQDTEESIRYQQDTEENIRYILHRLGFNEIEQAMKQLKQEYQALHTTDSNRSRREITTTVPKNFQDVLHHLGDYFKG